MTIKEKNYFKGMMLDEIYHVCDCVTVFYLSDKNGYHKATFRLNDVPNEERLMGVYTKKEAQKQDKRASELREFLSSLPKALSFRESGSGKYIFPIA